MNRELDLIEADFERKLKAQREEFERRLNQLSQPPIVVGLPSGSTLSEGELVERLFLRSKDELTTRIEQRLSNLDLSDLFRAAIDKLDMSKLDTQVAQAFTQPGPARDALFTELASWDMEGLAKEILEYWDDDKFRGQLLAELMKDDGYRTKLRDAIADMIADSVWSDGDFDSEDLRSDVADRLAERFVVTPTS